MRRVILDVDTGSDDAVAIMVALCSPEFEVLAITTVWGNLSVRETTANSLALTHAMGVRAPVYRGAHTAMVKDLQPFQSFANNYKPIVREDGASLRIHYDMLEMLPKTNWQEEKEHAVRYYIEALSSSESPLTLIATGPLTNLGWVFYLRPDLATKVERLVVMGGGVEISNVTESAEANFWHDPEALQHILNAGLKPMIVTLDATHSAALNLEDCRQLEALESFAADFTAKLVRQRIEYESAFFGPERQWSAIHDALAVCVCLEPRIILKSREACVSVALAAQNCGELLVDEREMSAPANATVVLQADHDLFLDRLISSFKKS